MLSPRLELGSWQSSGLSSWGVASCVLVSGDREPRQEPSEKIRVTGTSGQFGRAGGAPDAKPAGAAIPRVGGVPVMAELVHPLHIVEFGGDAAVELEPVEEGRS